MLTTCDLVHDWFHIASGELIVWVVDREYCFCFGYVTEFDV